jgi:tetratricopeptide (TPR) repeat protein/tRNA A-37 threonylcarbamoyl transferase component Bud32
MTGDLRAQLEHLLASTYSLERELGGGGMSRVFVATEKALGRRVVIKVLPPELAEGVSVDRFKREIHLAAQLQHPHILGVLSAGEIDGLPYFSMPYVDGHSLRARLAAAGQMPLGEIVAVLRDVAKALAYAHDHGIVHRDIKPDNVLLTGGSAVVSDFGIAKAIVAARTPSHGGTLTQLGSALGTPQYMAPEQAAADPDVDHRADIYAFGVMAYEMLAGRPPFTGAPRKLLAAHMAEQPQDVTSVRPDTPPELAALVMRALAKDAADRPQSAAEVLRIVESASSGGTHPAMPQVLMAGRPRLGRALALWAGAFVAALILARAAIVGFGLPDWVLPATIVVMVLGLPAIVFTWLVHRSAHEAVTTAATTPGGSTRSRSSLSRLVMRAEPFVSWRRTLMGGVYAVATLVVVVILYMLARAMGIGPAGSLLARGVMDANQRVLVAEFQGSGADSTIGPVVTEAFRTALAQSQAITVMPRNRIRDALRRMQRDPGTRVDFAVAREIATRDGLKAFVDGEVTSIGGRYSIGARVVETQSGQPVASFQEAAANQGQLLPAIDRLAKRLRERIGESLKTIRDAQPLQQVTTPSLEALRRYVQGVRVIEIDGNFAMGEPLLNEAIALDTGFAMAYRKLGAEYFNRLDVGRSMAMFTKAYEHRDRLTEAERYLAAADYWSSGPHQDLDKGAAAYDALLEIDPNNTTAINNDGLVYMFARNLPRAQAIFKRGTELADAPSVIFTNLATTSLAMADTTTARWATEEALRRFSANRKTVLAAAQLLAALGQRDTAIAIARALENSPAAEPDVRAGAKRLLATFAFVEGRVADGRALVADAWRLDARLSNAALDAQLDDAWVDAWMLRDESRGRAKARAALLLHPLERIEVGNRPYQHATHVLALLGETARAKEVLATYERDNADVQRWTDVLQRHRMRGEIAMAEGRYADAAKEFATADVVTPCTVCLLPIRARAYDAQGDAMADSAIALYTAYVTSPDQGRTATRRGIGVDAEFLPEAYKRLGELWEVKGDTRQAVDYYSRFVALWKNADPELQPVVADVRRRIARLERNEGR